MLDFILPASNDLLVVVDQGPPESEAEWAAVRRAAVTLAESATLLTAPSRARDQDEWTRLAKTLGELGGATYTAARAKDAKALIALADPLNTACAACHTQYRSNAVRRDSAPK